MIPLHILTKNELTEHDVFEFMKGNFTGTHWREDSLYVPEDLFQQMELGKIFLISLNHFSYFGVTTVLPNEWDNVKRVTKQDFPLSLEIITEIDHWVQICFETEKCFSICGI